MVRGPRIVPPSAASDRLPKVALAGAHTDSLEVAGAIGETRLRWHDPGSLSAGRTAKESLRRLRRPRAGVNLDCFSAGGPVVPSPVTDEQAALRRVATLIARAAQPPAVFAAVAEEVGRLLPADHAFVVRYLRVERPAKGGTLVAADIPLPD
jgi:hypothetical protein